ncbi:MFS general substrate transporter [Bimuria novae-zelandiae CBS 107.79]|uniref:MFS general substrate transporter n=1 Tax=Bimuria novae-zelandiae CBS 107.79 TaxID=1447943 RepID=A0A6A5VUA0_9PLEO|nr:MFS general substrate transporter [Bimuria novae-zelandiae CBS 107.79]
MMRELIRDASFGQLLRYLMNNRVLHYPEEEPGFQWLAAHSEGRSHSSKKPTNRDDIEKQELPGNDTNSSTAEAAMEEVVDDSLQNIEKTSSTTPSDPPEEDEALRPISVASRPIAPIRTADGVILVDWYATDDPDNPQNWSSKKKIWTAFVINIYTFVVYASSSIYVSSHGLIMERFGVGDFKASLGLALYVLGYGMGPLIFAPLSEVATFGRNTPYITTFALFIILALPTSLVDNLGGLLALRFLLRFFGSPCLASGGASMGDMYSFLTLPYAIGWWVSAAFAAPALGPLLSGFAVLWMAGPVFLIFFFFVPETSPSTILLHRAALLRKASGNEKIRSQTEIKSHGISLKNVVVEAILKPLEITFKDPAMLFVNVYIALTYGIYYSFFEVFPLVYPVMYGFNVGVTGVVFVCIIVGCIISMAIYFSYLYFFLNPDVRANGLRAQEYRLRPALLACFGPTIGLFLFAWLANPSIHWMGTVVGCTIYAITVYIIMQCVFTYIPLPYPQYAASLFAGNDLFRSLFASGSVLFSRSMYINLGVDKGLSLLGGLSVIGIIGMWLLCFYGAKLRARSKFAVS